MLENHFLGLSHPRAWRVLFHLPDQAFFISQRSKSDPWACDAFPELRPVRSRAGVDHEEKSDLGTQRRAVHFSQVDKGPGTLRLEVCKGWLLLLRTHSSSQNGNSWASDPFLKTWRKVEGEGEGRIEVYKVIFQTPNQPTLLYWAIISFPSIHWNPARIPSQFILFY